MFPPKTRMKCLIDPTEKERIDREPLLNYSFFLSSKNILLLDMIDTIIGNLDSGFSSKPINSDLIGEASVFTWFWVLGAYEIVRTMSQTKDCFSEAAYNKLVALKQELAKARMPNSKMEKTRQKTIPVNSNRCFDGWDYENRDLMIGDPECALSARVLFKLYDDTITSIKPGDILKEHCLSEQYCKTKK